MCDKIIKTLATGVNPLPINKQHYLYDIGIHI